MQKSFSEDMENDIISFESCMYDSNINGINIPKQAKMVMNYIIWFLNRNNFKSESKELTIQYKRITENCRQKYNEFIKHSALSTRYDKETGLYAQYSIGECLGIINGFLSEKNLPFISVLVVAKDSEGDKIPENGFFECLWDYREIYKYDLLLNNQKEDIKKLTKYEKRKLVKDVREKIEEKFDEIIEALKQLNNKQFFCGYSSEKTIENINPKINLEIAQIEQNEYSETEKESIVKIRIGQSQLRIEKLEQEKCCEICGVKTQKLLIVSHIKPWAVSNNIEKLDTENTLLLCPTHDALFDKGYISFDARGRIKISKELDEMEQALFNINDDSKIEVKSNKKSNYLNYHLRNIFLDNQK